MRIGELLLESELIDAKQLADALHYARAKGMPLGRTLKILKHLTDRDLERALEAQQLIRKGLPPKIGAEVLRMAAKRGMTVTEALQERSKGGEPLAAVKAAVASSDAPPMPTPAATLVSPFALMEEGDRLFAEDRCSEAEHHYKEAHEKLVAARGENDAEVVPALKKLGNLYLSTDRFDEAQQLYQQALEIERAQRGKNDPMVAKALEDLGDLYAAKNDRLEARKLLNQAYQIAIKQDSVDIELAGRLLKKLAGVSEFDDQLNRRKRVGEFLTDAEMLSDADLIAALKRADATHRPLGTVLRDEQFLEPDQIESLMLAQLLTKEGIVPYVVAVKALALAHKTGMPLKQICEAGRIVSDDSEDSQQYRQLVLEQDKLLTAETLLGGNHVEVAIIAERLADLYMEHYDRHSALMLYKRAKTIYERAGNDVSERSRVALLYEKYGRALVAENQLDDAQPLFDHALNVLTYTAENQLQQASLLEQLGAIHFYKRQVEVALAHLTKALFIYDEIDANACPLSLLELLVKAQLECGLHGDADATYQRIIDWSQRVNGLFAPETGMYMERLGDMYQKIGRLEKARIAYNFAMQIYERNAGYEQKFKNLDEKLVAAGGHPTARKADQ